MVIRPPGPSYLTVTPLVNDGFLTPPLSGPEGGTAGGLFVCGSRTFCGRLSLLCIPDDGKLLTVQPPSDGNEKVIAVVNTKTLYLLQLKATGLKVTIKLPLLHRFIQHAGFTRHCYVHFVFGLLPSL